MISHVLLEEVLGYIGFLENKEIDNKISEEKYMNKLFLFIFNLFYLF